MAIKYIAFYVTSLPRKGFEKNYVMHEINGVRVWLRLADVTNYSDPLQAAETLSLPGETLLNTIEAE